MDRKMKNKEFASLSALAMSISAITISVAAICVAAPNIHDLKFDYQGVIVGVLSILVTSLIGWNIYTMIDIKSTNEKINEIESGASFMVQRNMALSEGADWMIYHYLLIGKDPLGLEYRFIYHGVACLYHTSQISDIKTCNAIVKGLLECIHKPDLITIKKSQKDEIIKLLYGLKNAGSIDGYHELLNRLALINVS